MVVENAIAPPMDTLQFSDAGGFVWRPRLPNLRDLAPLMGEDAVATVFTDSSGKHGWGATLGGRYTQGMWSEWGRAGGINWKELWVLRRALESRGELLAGKLVLVRMDNSAAASYRVRIPARAASHSRRYSPGMCKSAKSPSGARSQLCASPVRTTRRPMRCPAFQSAPAGWAFAQNVSCGKRSAARPKSGAGQSTAT